MVVVQEHQTAACVLLMQQSRLPFLKELCLVQGLGIDLVAISRFAQWLDRYDRETLGLVFTSEEIERCQAVSQQDLFYAICFATKEAVGKALKTGLVGIQWTEIDAILTEHQLEIQLQGNAQNYAVHKGIDHWQAVWVAWNDHVLVQVIGFVDNR